MLKIILSFVVLLISQHIHAEIIQTTDGRTVDLKDDGTYVFLQSKESIDIIPVGCKEYFSSKIEKDDFGSVAGHRYYFSFLMSYEIKNNTSHPIALTRFAARYSKDLGWVSTQRTIGNARNPINVNDSIVLSDTGIGHALHFSSEQELTEDKIKKLKEENGCSDSNFANQTISIILAKTKIKTHPDAGNIDWKSLISINKQFEKFGSLQFVID